MIGLVGEGLVIGVVAESWPGVEQFPLQVRIDAPRVQFL